MIGIIISVVGFISLVVTIFARCKSGDMNFYKKDFWVIFIYVVELLIIATGVVLIILKI